MLHRVYSSLSKRYRYQQEIHHFRIGESLDTKSLESCLQTLRRVQENDPSAIFMSVNSSQANIAHINSLFHAFRYAAQRAHAPTYTFIEDYATTQGYLLACASKTIIATPFSLIGETGIFRTYRNIQRLLEILKIKYTNLGNPQHAALGTAYRKPTAEQRQSNEQYVRKLDQDLVKTVLECRPNLKSQTLDSVRNKLVSPKKALELGLIDSISTFDEFRRVNYPNHKLREYAFGRSQYKLVIGAEDEALFRKLHKSVRLSMEVPIQFTMPGEWEAVIQDLQNSIATKMEDVQFMDYLETKVCPQIIQSIEDSLAEIPPIQFRV